MNKTSDTVRFIKTSSVMWNGNGFGNSTAEWVALIGDVQVGVFENDGRISEAFGHAVCVRATTKWKSYVRLVAANQDWL